MVFNFRKEPKMEDKLLIASLEGVIVCTAIDSEMARIREDAYRISKDEERQTRQIDIAVVIPAEEKLLEISLKRALESRRLKNERVSPIKFFSQEDRENLSLQVVDPRKVLVSTFVFDEDQILLEEVSIGRACADFQTHDEARKTRQPYQDLSRISRIISLKQKRGDKTFFPNTAMGPGEKVVYHLLRLFNEVCIRAAKAKDCPYIFVNPDGEVVVNGSWAIFNKPLRDPFAFINLMNLVNTIEEKELFKSEDELRELASK